MNMRLFQEIFELNQAFERVIEGLKRMEKVTLFLLEVVRETRAEVVLVQVDFNRQFFDQFHKVFEKDEGWACDFTDACREKRIDPDDAYLEIRRREEMRRKKGLPPRVTLLPDWDMGDEQPHGDDRSERRKQAAVPRYPWQGCALGRPCIRGGHSLHPRPIHRQDRIVLEDCHYHRD
jgi:hypothetical protein